MKIWKKKNYSIICLQDIHISENEKDTMTNEWGLNCIIASFKSNSRGVAILFNNNVEIKVHKSLIDKNGNFIITDMTLDGMKLTLTNLARKGV